MSSDLLSHPGSPASPGSPAGPGSPARQDSRVRQDALVRQDSHVRPGSRPLTPQDVATLVAEVVAGAAVAPSTDLLDLPGFTSIAIAELVERLEQEIGTDVPPELIVPETFETPATIATALAGLGRPVLGPPRFLHDLLDAAVVEAWSRTAIVHAGAAVTYGDLRERSLQGAAWLSSLGVGRGDRVVVGLGNVHHTIEAMYALSRAGAVFIPVEPTAPAWSLGHIIADADPSLVIGPLHDAVSAAGSGAPVRDWLTGSGAASPIVDRTAASPDDTACILYTSGSTGRPKGIVCPHRAMLFALEAISARLKIAPDDVIGCVLPLTFDYGLYQSLLAARHGATLALGGATDAGPALCEFLDSHGATGLPAVPSLAVMLAQLARRGSPERRPPLRWISNTGSALIPALADRLEELFPGVEIYAMYGLTECKRVSILLPGERRDRPASVGRPLDGTEVVIVDPADGSPLPAGETGEIVVRGPHLMDGYWGVEPGADGRFRQWGSDGARALFTGDLGHLDADGYLYFDGRGDGLYKVSGFRVSAEEVELAASEIDGVQECAVVLSQGDRQPTLVVAGEVTVAELRAGLLARLEAFKAPDRIVVIDRIPHSRNCKIDRRALRRMLEEAGVAEEAEQ